MGIYTRHGKMSQASACKRIYRILFNFFGPQHWWPAQTPFEVMVGAVLVQNTNWKNAERVIDQLKRRSLLTPKKLNALNVRALASHIRPVGYFNVKAKRLKNFLSFFIDHYSGSVGRMKACSGTALRRELLSVNGIGPETADSILLYALQKPFFVIDAYTRRVFSRHGIIGKNDVYEKAQQIFMRSLPCDVKLYNEYHALIVKVAKDFCRTKPLCLACPLRCLKTINIRRGV